MESAFLLETKETRFLMKRENQQFDAAAVDLFFQARAASGSAEDRLKGCIEDPHRNWCSKMTLGLPPEHGLSLFALGSPMS